MFYYIKISKNIESTSAQIQQRLRNTYTDYIMMLYLNLCTNFSHAYSYIEVYSHRNRIGIKRVNRL